MFAKNKINIYDYSDYRKFLQEFYELEKSLDSSFSYRVFAAAVGMDASLLLKILQGKRHISPKCIDVFVNFFHFKDAKTDEVFASPAFNLSQWDVSWIETQEGAMMKALEKLSSTITDYCNKWLPLSANVLEGARDKKDKQKEVYIDLGSKEGAYEGLHMGVYTVKTIAGKEAKKQIGRLKIMEVLGDDISLCKVQSGGKDIKAALDAGETLVIQTTD